MVSCKTKMYYNYTELPSKNAYNAVGVILLAITLLIIITVIIEYFERKKHGR
jgi:hypothetical protein